jgi:hypothetical protein
MSSLNRKIWFHYQRTDDANNPIQNPISMKLSEPIDNNKVVYLLGYTFIPTINPAPTHYWFTPVDTPALQVRVHTNDTHNLRFPLFLGNAPDANNVAISHWYDHPQVIAEVRNTTGRLDRIGFKIENPDGTLTAWTAMAIWFMVCTPLGEFNMKKTPISPMVDPSYYSKTIGQEDIEQMLHYI